MAIENMSVVILSVIIGTLAAIVYSLRVLILMERRVERIEKHIENMVKSVIKEELKIEDMLRKNKPKKK